MTSSNDRLDQIEALLADTILVTRSNAIAITGLTQKIDQLTEAQEVTQAQVDVLVSGIDKLARRVDRVLDYLENQSGNGRHGTGGQPRP